MCQALPQARTTSSSSWDSLGGALLLFLVHKCVFKFICVYLCTCVSMYLCIHVYVWMCVYLCVCMCVSMYVPMCVHMWVTINYDCESVWLPKGQKIMVLLNQEKSIRFRVAKLYLSPYTRHTYKCQRWVHNLCLSVPKSVLSKAHLYMTLR